MKINQTTHYGLSFLLCLILMALNICFNIVNAQSVYRYGQLNVTNNTQYVYSGKYHRPLYRRYSYAPAPYFYPPYYFQSSTYYEPYFPYGYPFFQFGYSPYYYSALGLDFAESPSYPYADDYTGFPADEYTYGIPYAYPSYKAYKVYKTKPYYEHKPRYWVFAKAGTVPIGAIYRGYVSGKHTFYCRVVYRGRLIKGWLVENQGCYINYHGKTVKLRVYQAWIYYNG